VTLASQGYDIVVTGKTQQPHPKLTGTLSSVAAEVSAHGAKVLALPLDVRDEAQIHQTFEQIKQNFGALDVLVNNASAIDLSPTESLAMKRFDLMQQVNGRATFACTQAALPLLSQSSIARVVTLCPPLSLDKKWFKRCVAYTMSKYAMSLCMMGFAQEFGAKGITFSGLWPRTIIATAAVEFQIGKQLLSRARQPQIVADALVALLKKEAAICQGQFFLDEEVLRAAGRNDFSSYAVSEQQPLPDLYTQDFDW
jgi:citronellol/citronellal dehydrogenase